MLNNQFLWWIAGIMVVAKLAATVFSYSFGGSGGVFSPLLFLGGMGGCFVSGLVSLWIPMPSSSRMVIGSLATPDPVTLEAEHEVVFVVDQDGRLKGLITLHDLLRAQASLGD